MSASITRGRWRWESNGAWVNPDTFQSPGYYDNPELVSAGGVTVISAGGGEYVPYRNPADARAIAAVPDMVTALQVVSRCIPDAEGGTTLGSYEMGIVREALRAALGDDHG